MNRAEFMYFVAEIRKRWPSSPEWSETTLDVFFRDVEPYASEDVSRALTAFYRKGRASPPNGGQLLHILDNEGVRTLDKQRQLAAPPEQAEPMTLAEWQDFRVNELIEFANKYGGWTPDELDERIAKIRKPPSRVPAGFGDAA